MNVLIVGGSRGIGRAAAQEFLNNGDSVWVMSRTDPRLSGINWKTIDLLGTENCLNDLPIDFWQFDVVVNSVGINIKEKFLNYEIADLRTMIDVNLIVPFRIMQLSLPFMKNQHFGRILNICSIWSHVGMPLRSAYNITKFGLRGLTYSVASEVDDENILVNSISPGFVDTELTQTTLTEKERMHLVDSVPLKRMATPVEIANFISWLCSPNNTFCHGQDFIIDGGFLRS